MSARIDSLPISSPTPAPLDLDPAIGSAVVAPPDDSFAGPVAADSAPSALIDNSLLVRNDHQHKPDPKVLDLQKQVNAWRTASGKPTIKEDGFFGPQTQSAVSDFQKATGLAVDGRAGVRTEARLAFEDDATFKALDPTVKGVVRQELGAATTHTDQINNLKTVATQPGFEKLSVDTQKRMLTTQWANRNDPDLASSLATLSKSDSFRKVGAATQSQVVTSLGAMTGFAAGQQNAAALATAPGFDQLSPAHQQQMLKVLGADPGNAKLRDRLVKLAGDPAFRGESDASKTALINLAGDPTIPDANVKAATDLTESPSFASLSDGDKALVSEGLKGAKGDPAYAASVRALLDDPKFKSLSAEEKTAVLSQVKNYPDARSVKNTDLMLHKDWFTRQNLADKQRSLKTVGYLSQYDKGDRTVIDNTLHKFLDPSSNFKLVWKDYADPPGSTTYGEGDGSTLWLNRAKVPASNDSLPINGDTTHLVIDTVPHEVNHLVNVDKVAPTYKYFEAEYRAWYVGFKAEHGRPPTNQEAMEQRINWQLNPTSFYGKYAADALKDPKEAAKFYAFMSQLSGQKVDATNFKDVIAQDPGTWKTKDSPAPVPAGNLDNH